MFKNVLVGVDGRPSGRDAIALAGKLVEPGGDLTLAHVYGKELTLLRYADPDAIGKEQRSSEELLQSERAATGVEAATVSVLSTTPGQGLHEQAEEQDADLLVVGSSRHGPLGRAMLGDDTQASLNGASCAVAVAPAAYAAHPHQIAKVGVGYDDSAESKMALAAARAVAARTGATVHALEVISIPRYSYPGLVAPVAGDDIQALLEDAANRMAGIEANTRVDGLPNVHGSAVCGVAGEELAALGDRVDLLFVGSRSYGPWRRLILGSTSGYLQRHARCALIVLPRGAMPERA